MENKEVYGQELGGNWDEDETDKAERSHAELAEDNNNYPPGYESQ